MSHDDSMHVFTTAILNRVMPFYSSTGHKHYLCHTQNLTEQPDQLSLAFQVILTSLHCLFSLGPSSCRAAFRGVLEELESVSRSIVLRGDIADHDRVKSRLKTAGPELVPGFQFRNQSLKSKGSSFLEAAVHKKKKKKSCFYFFGVDRKKVILFNQQVKFPAFSSCNIRDIQLLSRKCETIFLIISNIWNVFVLWVKKS